jgi:hypothetical protein
MMRRFQRPRAGMVISGSGPDLKNELSGSQQPAGFPDPDLFDHAPIQVVAFSHPSVTGSRWCLSSHPTAAGSR